ncbi:MAG: endonuclease/exonuclease/phosphatase family protein [Candidatus Pacebacteria bacterium]|nr:endonuclease/exonuclease/phosphatase family protein [Candidatus Paceibacterota bacterium]MBP9715815.1 endonuclease/exonuclease/phosphatase family protein [Candidatus Paceibacterota bacterium]
MKLKILSWNIWCGTHLDEVIAFLKTADADIIGLQEVCVDGRGNIGELIAKELGYNYAHAAEMDIPVRFIDPNCAPDDPRTMKFGPAILTRHKIIKSEVIKLTEEGRKLIIKSDIEIGSEVVHVFSIHLNHTHQTHSELQDAQVESLINIASEEKTIVMGDFNSLPGSSVIKKMNESLKDAEQGSTTPTWSVYKYGCQICLIDSVIHKLDYIFTSKDVRTDSFIVHESKGSDHLPLSAIIEI